MTMVVKFCQKNILKWAIIIKWYESANLHVLNVCPTLVLYLWIQNFYYTNASNLLSKYSIIIKSKKR